MLRKRPLAVLSVTALAISGFGALTLSTTAQAAPASDLMFSTYIEGSSNNKAIEIFNPTAAAVELSEYTITASFNGGSSERMLTPEPQSLPAGGYFVVTNAQASDELKEAGDVSDGVAGFNGDDALTLTKGSVLLDSIGQVGTDPGSDWSGADGASTANKTLTKKGCTVDLDTSDAYDPSVDFAATDQDDFSTLGRFTCDGLTPPDEVEPPEVIEGISLIGAVQGDGASSPLVDKVVTVQGHVVGAFQGERQFDGYYVQDAGDDNAATSDGIFVYAPGGQTFADGAYVEVTGAVSEAFDQTQIVPDSVKTVETTTTAPPATDLVVPVDDPERYEGMLVTFPDELIILEYFQYGRFGEIVLGPERQNTPTAVVEPGPLAEALANQNDARRLIMDDGRTDQNPSPVRHPNGNDFANDNFFRGGDKLVDVTGIMSYRNNAYKLQPTVGAEYIAANPRGEAPEVGGNFTIASFNVLNYFTTFKDADSNARGAKDADEFERQQQKIVQALADIDADVFGLIEIENNGGLAVKNLVTALNSNIGSETYNYVNTGMVGDDAITQALIYKSATTEPSGDFTFYDFNDQKNRPNLVQTFTHKASGESVNVSINHLKSKGSNCNSLGDPDLGDGAGNCNVTRTKAATEMMNWLAGDPTGQDADRTVLLGDLNSYDMEDPIDVIKAAGYTDLEKKYGGEFAYSYVFNGQIGYLDYAMANEAAEADVTGTAAWHINADEATIIDYTTSFKGPEIINLWEPTPYRSSDHDPVIVGMQLDEDGATDVAVTPVEAVFTQPTCDNPFGSITIPTTEGVDYLVNGGPAISGETYPLNPNGTNVLTATAQDGFVINDDFTQTIVINAVPDCPTPTPTPTVTAEPTPAPTVTVTAQPSPAPTVTVTATPTKPTGDDIYTTPGFHDVNGRRWMTTCEPYSVTVRCFTYIWGTQVRYIDGRFVNVNGWLFNNLTYVAAPRSVWEGNKLAFNNSWTASDGRRWRTECETAQTGRNGCRSYAEVSVVEASGTGYRQVKKFIFNNIVRFSN